jgi:hypothetical protein
VVKNLKKITKMTSTNQSEKTNKRKIAMFTIFLVVLCILGLSTILPVRSIDSSVTMKDVALNFAVAPSQVSLSEGSVYAQSGATVYCVAPMSSGLVVSYVSPLDSQGWATQSWASTSTLGIGSDSTVVQAISISNSYTMQVTPT